MTLRANDLHDLMDKIVEIDGYKSKMGSDENIVTVSFSTKTKESAEDLSSFLERGYTFVLDADATSGEQSDGLYKVFVELERNKSSINNIMEIIDGVQKLTGRDDLRYRYYKNWKSRELTADSLEEDLPIDPDDYGVNVNESNLSNYKNFFNKGFVDSVVYDEPRLTIQKKYADPVVFEFVDFGDKEEMHNKITESFDVNAYAEILFLTKYLGDYNVSKYGDKIFLENEGKVAVLRRI